MGFINDGHRYSYSQLNTVSECPYCFYLQKIEKNENANAENAFAQQGTLIHDILDKWAKGIIPLDELADEYEKRYSGEVTQRWPRMLETKGYAEKAYNLGLDYFKNFTGFEGYEIIDTEQKFETDIEGRKFIGIIDAVLRNKTTGGLVVLDHKSKSLTAFKKAENDMYRQQYLYSKYIYEKYEVFPETLMFNLFKEGGMLMSRPFSREEYEETLEWALEQIKKIEEYDLIDWFDTRDQCFFCQELCSCRKICPNGVTKMKRKG